jgi:hypothetical protein
MLALGGLVAHVPPVRQPWPVGTVEIRTFESELAKWIPFIFIVPLLSFDISVGVDNKLWAGRQRTGSSIPGRGKIS